MLRTSLLLLLSLTLLIPGCRKQPSPRLKVVVSTSMIAAIVRAIGGARVDATAVVPAGICPGHFDIPASALLAASQARLLINHGWEQWFPRLAAHTAPNTVQATVQTQGNWMVPPTHIAAANEIADLLKQVDPAGTETYENRRQHYLAQIDTAVGEVRRLLAGKNLPSVMGSEKQAPLLTWLGFRVIATYDRDEDITARGLSHLANIAVDSGVRLFVDNLQSDTDLGRSLAEATGARHIALSNFPLNGSYPEQLLANVRTLLEAIAQ